MLIYLDPVPLTLVAIPGAEPATPVIPATPSAPALAKLVPTVTPTGANGDSEPIVIRLNVAAYTLETHHRLKAIHLFVVAEGFTPNRPANPADMLSGVHPQANVDTSADLGGKEYDIAITNSRSVATGGAGPVLIQGVIDIDETA